MSISPLDADRTVAAVPARPGRSRRRTTVVSAVTFSLLAGAGLGAMTLTSGAEEATATPTTTAAVELAASAAVVDGLVTTSTEPATPTTEAPSVAPSTSVTTATTRTPNPATTAKPASPTTKAPTTSTTARIPATSNVVSFRGDGFGPVTLGQDYESARAELIAAYGSPTWEDEQWWTDGDGEIRAASWGALHVTFRGLGGNRTVAGAYYYALDTVVAGPELTTTHGLGTTTGLSLRYDETFGDGRPTVADPRHDSAVCVADGSGSVCAYFPNDVTEDGTYVHRPESLAWTVIVGDVDAPHGC